MERNDRKVIILPRFKNSLIEIWDYIAQDSVKQADKFLDDIEIVMEKIEKYPESNPMFRPLAGKRKLYRYKILKKHYLIVYKLLKVKLIYIRIVNSKRDPDYYKTLRTKNY
jgi:plasmid stabilization system protein ParE